MLHAYLSIRTGGWDVETCRCERKVDHGPDLHESSQAVAKRLDVEGLEVKELVSLSSCCCVEARSDDHADGEETVL